MSGASKVVALLPAYNAGAFIPRPLDALSAQDWPNFEVLASVDLSTDDTAEIIERHAARDPRFRLMRQTERQGWVGNINALIRAGDGDYFFFAFHDDEAEPGYAKTCARLLDERADAVLAYTDMLTTYVDGAAAAHAFPFIDGLEDPVARARILIAMRREWATPNRGLFRASVAKRLGGMRTHAAGEFIADWPWLLRLALEGAFLRAPGLLMRKNYTRQSLSQSADWRWDMAKFNAAADDCARAVKSSGLSARERAALLAALRRRRMKTRAAIAIAGARRAFAGAP